MNMHLKKREKNFIKEDGFTERLYRLRTAYRKRS